MGQPGHDGWPTPRRARQVPANGVSPAGYRPDADVPGAAPEPGQRRTTARSTRRWTGPGMWAEHPQRGGAPAGRDEPAPRDARLDDAPRSAGRAVGVGVPLRPSDRHRLRRRPAVHGGRRPPGWSTTTPSCPARRTCSTGSPASPTSATATKTAGSTRSRCAPTATRSTTTASYIGVGLSCLGLAAQPWDGPAPGRHRRHPGPLLRPAQRWHRHAAHPRGPQRPRPGRRARHRRPVLSARPRPVGQWIAALGRRLHARDRSRRVGPAPPPARDGRPSEPATDPRTRTRTTGNRP